MLYQEKLDLGALVGLGGGVAIVPARQQTWGIGPDHVNFRAPVRRILILNELVFTRESGTGGAIPGERGIEDGVVNECLGYELSRPVTVKSLAIYSHSPLHSITENSLSLPGGINVRLFNGVGHGHPSLIEEQTPFNHLNIMVTWFTQSLHA